MTTDVSIESLASQMHRAFVTKKRADGESFDTLCDGSPEWMRDACREAHDGMLPDDWAYSTIRSCVENIADAGEDADHPEPDCLTADLLAWAASHSHRVALCDEVIEEAGGATSLSDLLMAAQGREIDTIFCSLVASLGRVSEVLAETAV